MRKKVAVLAAARIGANRFSSTPAVPARLEVALERTLRVVLAPLARYATPG